MLNSSRPLARPHARRIAARAAALAALALCAVPAAAAAVTPAPASFDWGSVDLHGPQAPQLTITVTNTDASDTTVGAATLGGADPGQFQIAGDGCAGAGTLGPGGSCNVQVAFAPAATGSRSATVTVPSPSGDAVTTVSGTAVTGTLQASPDPLAFNPQPWYWGGQQQGVNLQALNQGVAIGSLSISGPDASYFSLAWNGCSSQTLSAWSSCGLGVAFNPTGPGTKTAQLVVPSDSSTSPLVVPISATALAGPVTTVTPLTHSFGNVAVGQAATAQAFTVKNTGDSPLQVQQALVVSGIPQAFPMIADSCAGRQMPPGGTCTFTIGFTPTRVGLAEASVFVISNTQSPVTEVGMSGVGYTPPAGAAVISGTPSAGSRVTCQPLGFGPDTRFAYSWLRGSAAIHRAHGASYVLTDSDIGSRLRCRVTATNPVGSTTVTSPATAPVQPRSLVGLPGSFAGRRTCRAVQVGPRLRVGGRTAAIGGGAPTIAVDPLSVSVPGARSVSVAIDGRTVAAGRSRATVPPRTLAAFADGRATLRVRAGGAAASTAMVLAPCRLAVRLVGGPGRSAAIRASATTGLGTLRISLPASLRLRVGRGSPGYAVVAAAGFPPQSLPLAGRITSSNGTRIALGAHAIVVSGLPSNTGVVSLFLNPRVLAGSGGTVAAAAPVLAGGTAHARSAAWWRR